MTIGLTGTLASGKDTAAHYLVGKGFRRYSLSDAVREECDARQLPKDRDTLRELANRLRIEFGPAVLAERIAARHRADQPANAVIVSIRHPAEVEILQRLPNFTLVTMDAPIQDRYQRVLARQREGDQISYQKFAEQERLERTSTEHHHQQIDRVMKLAAERLVNDGTLEQLWIKVDALRRRLER